MTIHFFHVKRKFALLLFLFTIGLPLLFQLGTNGHPTHAYVTITPPSPPDVPAGIQVSETNLNVSITKNYSKPSGKSMVFGLMLEGVGAEGWLLVVPESVSNTYRGIYGWYEAPGNPPGSGVAVPVEGFGFLDEIGFFSPTPYSPGGISYVQAYVNNSKPAGIYKVTYDLIEINKTGLRYLTQIYLTITVYEPVVYTPPTPTATPIPTTAPTSTPSPTTTPTPTARPTATPTPTFQPLPTLMPRFTIPWNFSFRSRTNPPTEINSSPTPSLLQTPAPTSFILRRPIPAR